MRHSKVTTLGIAFLMGCGASHVAKEAFTIAPAHADEAPRWDYACVEVSMYQRDEIEEALQKRGKKGWELVETFVMEEERFACFKRPL